MSYIMYGDEGEFATWAGARDIDIYDTDLDLAALYHLFSREAEAAEVWPDDDYVTTRTLHDHCDDCTTEAHKAEQVARRTGSVGASSHTSTDDGDVLHGATVERATP